MDNFSIAQLQQLSGIKAHTIRMWEQRYNALTPDRSEGNTRSYDNDQLRRLLNIVSLLNEGYKISELGIMTDAALQEHLALKLKNSSLNDDSNEYFVSQLIAAAMRYDESHFEKIYSQCVLLRGMNKTYDQVLYPLLKRIGLMWSIDSISPAQEHFSSHLLQQKIFSAIDALPIPVQSDKTWILFLPENEYHEIALLFAHYLIREAGQKVIYLGSNVPHETLNKAIKELNPTDLLFFFVHKINPEDADAYIENLGKSLQKVKIHFAGNEHLIGNLKSQNKINWIQTPEDLIQIIHQ